MPAVFRPRRSLLYMPGSNPRALEKARSLPADGLIIDFEDAVTAEAKESARAIVGAALAVGGYGGRELVVRVNPLDTPWGHADLAAAATMPIDAVLLPKVESAERVGLTVSLLDALGAPERLAVWCMIETPLGVLEVQRIAAASPRLAALVLGTSDLTKNLHALATRDRLPLITSLGLALLAARAHGLAILDGVHLDLLDEEGFAFALPAGPRVRVRRQDPDPPRADRAGEYRLRAEPRRNRMVAPHYRRARRSDLCGEGCRVGRRQANRKPARRECTAACGTRGGDRPARLR